MGVLHNFLEKSDQGRDALESSEQPFFELDLEKIKRDLNLIEEGRARGEKNLPAPTSQTLDNIEHKIVAVIETEQRRRQQSFSSRLNAYNQRIAGLDLESEIATIGVTANRASTEFVVKVDEGKSRLFTLWRNVCLIENQWNEFRKHHNLTHPADYPLSRLWNFAVILVILVIESILNGNFLARGLETGLVGGIIEASVIAAINVSFGVFLGTCVMRYLFHRHYLLRVLAFVEVPVSFGIAIMFNLLVGHYRDALAGPDPMHASLIALNAFTSQPLFLSSFQSWILFALGFFFFSVATFDGFKMDDPYPGYGKISRKHEEITQDYLNEKANIVDDLSYTRDRALDSIREARQGLAARRAEFANTLELREKLVGSLDSNQDYLNRAANDLLSIYRHANMHARTAPVPAYFETSYSLPKSSFAPQPSTVNVELLDVHIEKTDTALRNAMNQVNTKFEEAAGAFHQIGELTDKGNHGAATAST